MSWGKQYPKYQRTALVSSSKHNSPLLGLLDPDDEVNSPEDFNLQIYTRQVPS